MHPFECSDHANIDIPPLQKLPPISAPIFFGGALKDYICIAEHGQNMFTSYDFQDHNVTIRDFDGDHWIILSHADEINKELKQWLEGTVLAKGNLSQ